MSGLYEMRHFSEPLIFFTSAYSVFLCTVSVVFILLINLYRGDNRFSEKRKFFFSSDHLFI